MYPLARGISFKQYRNHLEYDKDENLLNMPEKNYLCDYSPNSQVFTVREWLERNDVPLNDLEDRAWCKKLIELSIEAKRNGTFQERKQELFWKLYE